eukprot:800976-Pyramimonas_sp.AAC.1
MARPPQGPRSWVGLWWPTLHRAPSPLPLGLRREPRPRGLHWGCRVSFAQAHRLGVLPSEGRDGGGCESTWVQSGKEAG